MIVIMCFALSLSYMLKYGDSMRNDIEGMTGEMKEGNMSEGDPTSSEIDKEDSVTDKPETPKEMPKPKAKMPADKATIKEPMAKASPGMDKETQAEYKNLLELQLKLIDGISNMQPILSEVAQKIDGMKKTMKSPGF
jgi:hypothetical protein